MRCYPAQGGITAHGFVFWAEWNSVLLERLREELRGAAERDEGVLAERTARMQAFRRA